MCEEKRDSDPNKEKKGSGDTWQCHRCTCEMPEEEALCGACGVMKGLWHCDDCDMFFFDETNICDSCGKEVELPGKKDEPSSPEILEEEKAVEPVREVSVPGNWFCPHCDAENGEKRKACSNCMKRRPAGLGDSPAKPSGDATPEDSPVKETDASTEPPAPAPTSVPPLKEGEWFCKECEIVNDPKRKACTQCYKSKNRVAAATG
jgi:hypothetical protein